MNGGYNWPHYVRGAGGGKSAVKSVLRLYGECGEVTKKSLFPFFMYVFMCISMQYICVTHDYYDPGKLVIRLISPSHFLVSEAMLLLMSFYCTRHRYVK